MGKLLDGVRDKGESWSAVIDGDGNDWVQVGAGGVCNLYSETGTLCGEPLLGTLCSKI